MISLPKIYSMKYIWNELIMPRLSKSEDMSFVPDKFSYIKRLIPVVLDLTQVQYNTWSALFRDAARNRNLLHHIDPTVPTPPDKHDDDGSVLITWIYATISPYLLSRITCPLKERTSTSVMDVWTCLRDVCQQHSITSQKKKRRFIRIDLNEDYHDHVEGGNLRVDLISLLPDDVLIHLLFLTNDMKTAGRTSVLCKRWKHVWTHLMDLDFYDPETMASLKSTRFPQPEMDKYVEWVNRVITTNRAPYLNTFRVHMPLSSSYDDHVQNWVRFAFVKQVRDLELNFGPHKQFPRVNMPWSPALILNTSLKSLHLEKVTMKGTLLQWVLTNCLNLQRLSLHHCKASTGDDAASSRQLVVSSLELKHLEILWSLSYLKFRMLSVFAPNLTSFLFVEVLNFDVEYRSIPSLVDAAFLGTYVPHSNTLSDISSQLEKLSVKSWDKLRSTSSGFFTFANLQQLEIIVVQGDHNLILSTSLIEACPLLHTFKLKLMHRQQLLNGPRRVISPDYGHKILAPADYGHQILAPKYAQENAIGHHQQLKTVEYFGYAGCPSAAELAICLARHAPMLERFIFYTRWPQLVRNRREVCSSDDYGDLAILREATEHLVERIQRTQSPVDVVID